MLSTYFFVLCSVSYIVCFLIWDKPLLELRVLFSFDSKTKAQAYSPYFKFLQAKYLQSSFIRGVGFPKHNVSSTLLHPFNVSLLNQGYTPLPGRNSKLQNASDLFDNELVSASRFLRQRRIKSRWLAFFLQY